MNETVSMQQLPVIMFKKTVNTQDRLPCRHKRPKYFQSQAAQQLGQLQPAPPEEVEEEVGQQHSGHPPGCALGAEGFWFRFQGCK